MATRQLPGTNSWTLRGASRLKPSRRRGARGPAEAAIPEMFLQSDAVTVEEVLEATPRAGAGRRGGPQELALEVDVEPGEGALVAVRHASGAITFHPSAERATRSARRGGATGGVDRFRIAVRSNAENGGRRGVLSKVVKVVVLKIAKIAIDKAVSFALPKLVAAVEKRLWLKKELSEGWFRVAPVDGAKPGLRLSPSIPKTGERSLLLVHGTFSNAAAAFGDLAGTDFFERIRPLYGDRVYAYNHFSLSRTPDENASLLLRGLGAGKRHFDAITHSRGGLVLRGLIEHRADFGTTADRFELGHAVLVASPNDGTPWMTPTRWDETVGWFANLIELFPDNPFTIGAEFVSESLVWLAAHLAGDVPGLSSMDGGGELVASLQSPPGPPGDAYSALVSNFHPDDKIFARALDVGVDSFFGTANDLVVPSEGGWRIDRDGDPHIPGARIGCYGPGGNLATAGNEGPTHHTNFFGRRATVDFLVNALARRPQPLPALDPDRPLPDRRFTRGARAATAPEPTSMVTVSGPLAAPEIAGIRSTGPREDFDTFHLLILDHFDPAAATKNDGDRESPKYARVLATYGGARVSEVMRLRKDEGEESTKFGKIIRFHERVQKYTNREEGSLPTDQEMLEFGGDLFQTLFTGDVRRLYDEARARQRGRKLDLVLTSMIPWVGEKPWEFAFDTGRCTFLATEEIHFVRNVHTNVPSDAMIEERDGPLRILVASAQPVGFGLLSIEQEREVVRRGFEPLIDAGLAHVEVLPRATPSALHGYLSTGQFDVVHFIGHGEFDKERGEGCLLFEDGDGNALRLYERSVREIFCQRGLSLVFLNACESGASGRADSNKGVAQSLVAHGLPALVANQYSVLDSSATSFAQHFYWALAQGMTLGQAARDARVAVNYALHGEPIDWAIPVMYARDPNRALCRKPAVSTRVPTTSVSAKQREDTKDHTIRIAVWDMDAAFPGLSRTLERMNAAQTVYGFQLTDISVPLDVWDLEEEANGIPYLKAERLADRLQSLPVELGVNVLACVTRHWLRDVNWLNLYGWWPGKQEQPVVIFSCAGFEKLEPEGVETDRVIANSLVETLAGFFADVDCHESGDEDCPLWFNGNREWAHIVGRQRFDAGCRAMLKRTLPKQLPALEALLEVFQPPREGQARAEKTVGRAKKAGRAKSAGRGKAARAKTASRGARSGPGSRRG